MKDKGKMKAEKPPPPCDADDEDGDDSSAEEIAAIDQMQALCLDPAADCEWHLPQGLVVDEDGAVVISDDETVAETVECAAQPRVDDPFAEAAEASLRDAPAEGPNAGPSHRKKRAYIVFKGRTPGVYRTWDATNDQVSGFTNNSFRGYRTEEAANAAWHHTLANSTTGPPGSSQQRLQATTQQTQSCPQTTRSGDTRSKSTPPKLAKRSATSCCHQNIASPPPGPVRFLIPNSQPRASSSHTHPTPQIHGGTPVLDDESVYWVVIQGRRPGVYYGHQAAQRALGSQGTGRVRKAATQEAANAIFVAEYMSGNVMRTE
ncbi:hypothetical protein LshimejAT787_0505670 [Lyophyllum shimeji]|uniref:Ribonuclease H1 N-terminal domain-containing protein n=1 Tax=Lyophyllum shimeji TaxID=47721 RepID=A0A9P3PNT7_LYOSH|nr:hypothetical protein LshimejAT787_0505670 [Lyophyllum shimeji]